MTFKGPGTVTLSGTSTRTVDVFVDGGTLFLDYSAQNNSKLSDTAAFGFNGGNAVIVGGSHVELGSAMTLFSATGSASIIARAGHCDIAA